MLNRPYFHLKILGKLCLPCLPCLPRWAATAYYLLSSCIIYPISFTLQFGPFTSLLLEPPEPKIRSDWTEAFPGEKVSLQCVIQGVPENWNNTWFKNSSKIFSSGDTNTTGNTLILSVKSSHYGAYMCQAELQGRNVTTAKSTPHLITVHGKYLLLFSLKWHVMVKS